MAVQICAVEESELQARLRIVQNVFKERHNCIVLHLDNYVDSEKGLNPFGFHFEFDRVKYEENKERKRRSSITRWLSLAAFVHHKFGLRHVLLIVLMTLYAVLGGLMFYAFEAEHEKEIVAQTISEMEIVIYDFVDLIVNVSLTVVDETTRTDTLAIKFYTKMLITEDRYLGSAWHKAEDLELNVQWTILPAMFYAYTVFTTIGYGTISCHTWVGRYVTIPYACIGIPLMLMTIGDLGEVLQRMLCRLIVWIERSWRSYRKNRVAEDVENNSEKGSEKGKVKEEGRAEESEEDSEKDRPASTLPVWIAVAIYLIYLCLLSVAIWLGDKLGRQETDFDLATSFYFTFITSSTVGFGDVLPNTVQFNPLTSLSFVFGLVLVSMINRSVYSKLYDAFYAGVMGMEAALEALHADAYETSGHKVFKKLSPAFSTISLSFPSAAFATPVNTNNIIIPRVEITAPHISERSSTEESIESLEERSHSFELPQIPDNRGRETIEVCVRGSDARPRAVAFLSIPGTFGMFTYSSRMGTPVLGALVGVDLAAARRRRRLARMRKERVQFK